MSQTPAQTIEDAMDPARAMACAAILDRPTPEATLPPLWHHVYFWDVRRPSDLGRDGHIARGVGLVPDMGLPRRMWAGGHVEFLSPLLLGQAATRRSTLRDIHRKTGRTGPLALVTLVHEIGQGGILKVRERQTLVYREDHDPHAAVPAPPMAPHPQIAVPRKFNALTLMRHAALSMNAHRIHWDAAYAHDVEGYPAPVVPAPLLSEGLVALATKQLGSVATFDYRATSPGFAGETLEFCLDGTHAFVRGDDGRLCMTGQVRVL